MAKYSKRERLIKEFNELDTWVKENCSENTLNSIKGSIICPPYPWNTIKQITPTRNITFGECGTVETLILKVRDDWNASKDNKYCILNFADAYSPGGGVRHGSNAQEENICQKSNLCQVLEGVREWENVIGKFYGIAKDPYYSDSLIYSPDVLILEKNEGNTSGNSSEDYLVVAQTAVITCAAPDQRHEAISDTADVFYNRTANVIGHAMVNKINVLILGAWGTGVFNNPTEEVAKGMMRACKDYEGFFINEIIFAIPDETKLEIFENEYRKIFKN